MTATNGLKPRWQRCWSKSDGNDVFRLYQTLAPADRFVLPSQLRHDLATFLEILPPDSPDWKDIRDAIQGLPEPERVVVQIRDNFGIGGTF